MWPALKPSQRTAVVAAIDPQSAAAAVTSGWVDASIAANYLAIIANGALGAGATVDAKLEQAKDAAGTGAKDIAGKAIAQLTKAAPDGSSTQQLINLRADELDINGGFSFFRLKITGGVAASLVAGLVLRFDGKQLPPAGATSQTQIV